jgi:chemotaxis protein MotB
MAPAYNDVIREVTSVLALKKAKIEVQGHSDDIPIRTSRFRSNWELSSSRAVSVAHELMLGGDISSRRFQISGYADTQPLVPNNSSENRARNRRVEILVKQGLEDELTEEDVELLKEDEQGQDILRELNLEPEYLFDLEPEEIF